LSENLIFSVDGPVVTVPNTADFSMQEMVYVGRRRLVGEVIGISSQLTTIQVYESPTGLSPGEPVESTGMPLCATLGPGILSGIFDGIQRPLVAIADRSGHFISQGLDIPPLDAGRRWQVTVLARPGEALADGQIYASCPETPLIEHRCPVPPGMAGQVTWAAPDGEYTVDDPIVRLTDSHGNEQTLTLSQRWPVRRPRPVKERLSISVPLITGQRVIDTLFPIAKGGTAAIPGGFGTGKTMTQHQLAKWCDADIILYVGCGERGNEMTQVLEEFSALIDPKSGQPLMARTALIANTSNMPVAAREASIYTGITLAEYYRDMGYHVALMADSTSRWAEALREISGRLEEMPAEEGFPAYLPSRISQFYERAGHLVALCGREGSVSIIGAVSPQGADFSEPVTQNTRRFVRCFLALDQSLAYARHYPAIHWAHSNSEYAEALARWYEKNVDRAFLKRRQEILALLAEEDRLMEIVKLIGADVLPDDQKLVLEIARVIRVGFLQQNAYHPFDTFVPLKKQLKMMEVILYLYHKASAAVLRNIPLADVMELGLFEKLVRMKYDVDNENLRPLDDYYNLIYQAFDRLSRAAGGEENT
jgi:V/A-type H+-transporting ATPase subunit A